ncbi:unnamed protein product, partial [Brassica oleracea]
IDHHLRIFQWLWLKISFCRHVDGDSLQTCSADSTENVFFDPPRFTQIFNIRIYLLLKLEWTGRKKLSCRAIGGYVR